MLLLIAEGRVLFNFAACQGFSFAACYGILISLW